LLRDTAILPHTVAHGVEKPGALEGLEETERVATPDEGRISLLKVANEIASVVCWDHVHVEWP
jgi:hypothetical protein